MACSQASRQETKKKKRDLAEEYLVSKGPVVVGGVEEGDASAEGMHDYSGASLVVE
jgi:hypothetical protein